MVYMALINYTPDPERTIAATARVSSSAVGATKLLQKLTPQDGDRLLARLIAFTLTCSVPASRWRMPDMYFLRLGGPGW